MNVTLIRENEDGSADYAFDLTKEEQEDLVRHGILEALKAAIREGEKLKVDGEDI
jgi:anti-sigma28 factor (negative regulator of flagellin synthesis)